MHKRVRGYCRLAAGAGLAIGLTGGMAAAQVQDVSVGVPTLDRWVYTFGSEAGAESEATVFSILGSGFESTFDIRDGQLLVGYQTGGVVAAGLGETHYRVLSASVTVRTSRDRVFVYDPTFDAVQTYLDPSDAAYVADADAGRPVELYAVGYRNGYTVTTYMENTPFGVGNPAQKRVRSAFAAQYQNADGSGALVDVSNNAWDQAGFPRFEARPLAIGLAPVAAGAAVPIDTDFTFNIDLGSPGAIRYLREGLNAGRLNFMVSSMTPTSQQSSATPAFYTKEYPAALGGVPARLSLRACAGAPADWNCSGVVSVQDVFDYLADYFAGRGDFNASGATSVQDIFDFLAAYFGG